MRSVTSSVAVFATGVAEEMQAEVRIVLLRPPQIVQPTEWTVADVPLAAGETKDVALPSVNEPALGTFSFASAPEDVPIGKAGGGGVQLRQLQLHSHHNSRGKI